MLPDFDKDPGVILMGEQEFRQATDDHYGLHKRDGL
jgi:hypothetical protein